MSQLPAPKPAVSVITPVRNGQALLAACLGSVRNQSFQNWEHIVIDDASSDATRELLREEAAQDARLRFVLLDEPGGAARARNAGMTVAEGRFIAFLDVDDLWFPEKLSAQLLFMQQNDLAFSYGSYSVQSGRPPMNKASFVPPPALTYRILLGGCPIGCLTAMYDRLKLGTRLFPDIRRGQDWALWLQLAREGASMERYPGLHAVYSHRTRSLSSNKVAKLRDVWRIYREQEAQGFWRSTLHLGRHFWHVVNKRRTLRGTKAQPGGLRRLVTGQETSGSPDQAP